MPTRYVLTAFSRSALVSGAPTGVGAGVGATPVGGPFDVLDAPFALGYFTGLTDDHPGCILLYS